MWQKGRRVEFTATKGAHSCRQQPHSGGGLGAEAPQVADNVRWYSARGLAVQAAQQAIGKGTPQVSWW